MRFLSNLKINTRIWLLSLIAFANVMIAIEFMTVHKLQKVEASIAHSYMLGIQSRLQAELTQKYNIGLTNTAGIAGNPDINQALINNDKQTALT